MIRLTTVPIHLPLTVTQCFAIVSSLRSRIASVGVGRGVKIAMHALVFQTNNGLQPSVDS